MPLRAPGSVRVPESIINGSQHCLDHNPRTLSCHVLIARVCGASRRSLAVRGMWSPACSRSTASAMLLVGQQGDPRIPTWLKSDGQNPLGRAVNAAARRSVGRRSTLHPVQLLRLALSTRFWKS